MVAHVWMSEKSSNAGILQHSIGSVLLGGGLKHLLSTLFFDGSCAIHNNASTDHAIATNARTWIEFIGTNNLSLHKYLKLKQKHKNYQNVLENQPTTALRKF